MGTNRIASRATDASKPAPRKVAPGPGLGHRVRRLEEERTSAGDLSGVLDGTAGRVVPEALGDAVPVGEEAQESAAVAARVEDSSTGDIHIDRVEHGLPDEPV